MEMYGAKLGFVRFFFHHHFTAVVKLAFKPVRTVEHVRLAGGWADRYVRRFGLVVGTALARTCFRLFAFWMCHYAVF